MSFERNLNSVYPDAVKEFNMACSYCDKKVWKLFHIDPYNNDIYKKYYLEFIQEIDANKRFSASYEKNILNCIFFAIRATLKQEENDILNNMESLGIPLDKPLALISYFSDYLKINPNSYPAKKLLAQSEVYKEIEAIPSFAGKVSFSEIGKFVIDGEKWKLGDYAFDDEPGYILGAFKGLVFALKTRDDEKTPDWYIKLHDTCIGEVYTQLGKIKEIFFPLGNTKKRFGNPNLNLTRGFSTYYVASGTRKKALIYCTDTLDSDIYGRKDLEEDNRNQWIIYGFDTMLELKRFGLMTLPDQTPQAIKVRMNKLFSGYQSLLSQAQDNADKLIAYLWLVRELEIHHFFADGNGRSAMLALQSMACSKIAKGIFPMLFYDPNVLDANGPEKLCLRAIEAMTHLITISPSLQNKRSNTYQSELLQLKQTVIKKFHNQPWGIIHARTGLKDIYELPEISNYIAKLKEIGCAKLTLSKKQQKALDEYEKMMGHTQLTQEIAENFIRKLKSMTQDPNEDSDLDDSSSLSYLRAKLEVSTGFFDFFKSPVISYLDIASAPTFLTIEKKINNSVPPPPVLGNL